MQRQFPTMEELRQRHQQYKKKFDIMKFDWIGIKMKIDKVDINEPYVRDITFSSEKEEDTVAYFNQLQDAGFQPFVVKKYMQIISYCLELRIINPLFGDDDPINPYPEPTFNENCKPATLKDWFLKYRKDRREGILAADISIRYKINRYLDTPVEDTFSLSCHDYASLAAPKVVKELREEGIYVEVDKSHEKHTIEHGMSQHTITYFKIILNPQ